MRCKQSLLIIIIQMDNESNNSEDQYSEYTFQNAKPNNRNIFNHKGLCIRSDFPGGNLQEASFQQQFRLQAKPALLVQFWGNSDAQSDPADKSWFYFTVSGMKDIRISKYDQIIFKFKNANTYRKFIKQKKYRPYIVYKEQKQKIHNEWKTIFISKMNVDFLRLAHNIGIVCVDRASFALNLPYNLSNLERLNDRMLDLIDLTNQIKLYYHREIIAQSVDLYPVYMFTLTSKNNILSFQSRQQGLWPYKGCRPFQLKQRPQIVITSRVHPSQISSSFCVEGIIQALMKNPDYQLLLNIFIFRVIPMVNPDGVENGHYRLDNYLQNLNRFYGHSNQTKTPSVYAIEKLIINLRQKSKLFFFMDIHGHNSPKPTFIFGNHTQNFYQLLQNKTFVKLMEVLCGGNFSAIQSQFSKKNMTIKQKYDQHSKQACARVFAYQGNSYSSNNQLSQNSGKSQAKPQIYVEHSYTLQVHPYVIGNNCKSILRMQSSYRNLPQFSTSTTRKVQNTVYIVQPCQEQIILQYKQIGQSVLISILQLIGANTNTTTIPSGLNLTNRSTDNQSGSMQRKRALRQISKMPQFYDRQKRNRQKEINRQLYDRYYSNWNFLQLYKQYLNNTESNKQSIQNDSNLCNVSNRTNNSQFKIQAHKAKIRSCPLIQIYQQLNSKKNNSKKSRIAIANQSQKNNLQLNLRNAGENKKECITQEGQQQQQTLQSNIDGTTQINQINLSINYQDYINKERQKFEIELRKISKQYNSQKKQSSVKQMQLQMLQKIQMQNIKQRQNRLINAYSLKSCTPTLSPDKARIKGQDPNQMQRKIKKLIFRHKTQIQKQYASGNKNIKEFKSNNGRRRDDRLLNMSQFQYVQIQSEMQKNQKLKQLQLQYLKNMVQNNPNFNYNYETKKNKTKLSNIVTLSRNLDQVESKGNLDDESKNTNIRNSKNKNIAEQIQKKFNAEKLSFNWQNRSKQQIVSNRNTNTNQNNKDNNKAEKSYKDEGLSPPDSKPKTRIVQKFNPRIEELVKRISTNKQKDNKARKNNNHINMSTSKQVAGTIVSNKYYSSQNNKYTIISNNKSKDSNTDNQNIAENNKIKQINRIKSTKIISNLILSKSKRKYPNISENQKQQNECSTIIHKTGQQNKDNQVNDEKNINKQGVPVKKRSIKSEAKSILIPLIYKSKMKSRIDTLANVSALYDRSATKFDSYTDVDMSAYQIPQSIRVSNNDVSQEMQSQFAIKNNYYNALTKSNSSNKNKNTSLQAESNVKSRSRNISIDNIKNEMNNIFNDANIESQLDTINKYSSKNIHKKYLSNGSPEKSKMFGTIQQ